MDVLQLIKSQNDKVLDTLKSHLAETHASAKELKASMEECIDRHFALESQFLFPEIEGLFPRSDLLVKTGEINHRSISALLGQISGRTGSQKALQIANQIFDLLSQHIEMIEDTLMPSMRRAVPTAQREELGAVFLDLAGDDVALKAQAAPVFRRRA